ncbi:MAG TPA: hypothetical protein VEL82_05910 [Thermoplasmata archaeon]|nr:hypothetical protein [Thermoplasmata archaeon]
MTASTEVEHVDVVPPAGVTRTLEVDASANDVFETVSTAGGLRGWWCKNIDGSDKEGSKLVLKFPNDVWTLSLVKATRPARVEWKVVDQSEKKELIGTKILFQIGSKGASRSELRFLHAGLTPKCACFGPCDGAWTYLMGSMKNYLETGKGGAV